MTKIKLSTIIMFYALASAIFSFAPTFGESHDNGGILKSVLHESSSQIEQKIAEFEASGLIVPSTVVAAYNEGLTEYEAALASLEQEDVDGAQEHAVQAMSLFEDGLERIFEAENLAKGNDYLVESFELSESITNLETEADEIQSLVSDNSLDISFGEYDNAINQAKELVATGDLLDAAQQLDFADETLEEIHDQIDEETDSNQDERIKDFVENTIQQLDGIVANANALGLSPSVIESLENTLSILKSTDDPSSLFEVTSESSLGNLVSEISDADLEGNLEEESASQQAESDAESARQQAESDAESDQNSDSSYENGELEERSDANELEADYEDEIDDDQAKSDAESVRQQAESDAESASQQAESDAESASQQAASDAESASQQAASDAESARQQAESDAKG